MHSERSTLGLEISISPSLAYAQGTAVGKDNSTAAVLLYTILPLVVLIMIAVIFWRTQRGRAEKEKPFERNTVKMLRHAPFAFFLTAALAAGSALRLHSPIAYVLASIGIGVLWLVLLVSAWRLRSHFAVIASCVIIGVAQQLLSGRLIPDNEFGFVPGPLISLSLVFLLMWSLRGWLPRFCRFTDETHAAG
jgi:hypothetical protein